MITLHRGPGTAALADALGDLLARPLADPFAKEAVVVPAKGVERWLAQRLSHRLGVGPGRADGVCAGITFLRPRSLVAVLTGTERTDPWHPDRLAWPLLSVVDESLAESWAAAVARHLGEDHDGIERDLRRARRYGLARRLAGLFASYGVQRPTLLTDWREGRDEDVPADLAWQPELWRRVVERVGAPPPDVRHLETCAALREDPGRFPLPDRLSLFGHTRLPVTEVELLAAVGASREVHLFLPQVSAQAWEELRAEVADGPVRRAEDESARVVRHPLLTTLGRDARETQRQLAPLDCADAVAPAPDPGDHLLGWLQADLRADAPPAAHPERVLRDDDRSVQVHACHGSVRQVEVLRDVLLGLLEDDPTLEPRDILVMCPDVEAFAPLVHAVFGAVPEGHPARELRVSMADRGLASTNALLAIAGQLVSLVDGRARATDVLDILGTPPVRRRFAFSDDDLDTITRWVVSSGVRWGLDADHRRTHGLSLHENTWRFGLDRILAGVAMPEEKVLLGQALPVDDVGSSDVELAGRLAEALTRIDSCVDDLASATSPTAWSERLRRHVLALTATSYDDAWQVAQLEHELAKVAADAADGGGSDLGIADVRRLLEDRTAPRPTRANFRTGTLTVSTLVPMRSVPHRVVCLLGMDADSFPRTTTVDGDDALARDPRTGERDPRAEDRQLLLDAVMSARDALVITYAGMSEHSGQDRPPAIPVGELVDALDRTAAAPVRERILTKQPLQPYAERLLVAERPTTFDPLALQAAGAARDPRPAPPFLAGPVSAPPPELTLEDLRKFFANPARALLTHLEISLPYDVDPPGNDIPIDLSGLERWDVGDDIVRAVLDGADPQAVLTAALRRGTLPPGDLGAKELERICESAQKVVQQAMAHRVGEPVTTDVALEVDGRLLTGRVPDRHGDLLVRVTYSSLKGTQALALWLDLLAVQAAEPGTEVRGIVIAKNGQGRIGPVDPELARSTLAAWTAIRHEGLQRLCHLPLETGRAWAKAGDDRWAARRGAREKWEWDKFKPERADPAWCYLLGAAAPLDRLTELAALAEQAWRNVLPYERGWR